MKHLLCLLLLGAIHAAAAPCTVNDKTCMERVPLGGKAFFTVYRSLPLTVSSAAVKRVFILVHGVGRDGDVYFKSALAATQDSAEMENTLVIAPQFHATDGKCADGPKMEQGETAFACRGWSDGVGDAASPISSFTAMDALLREVANKKVFPSLQEIVVTGHSAGGQFVQRYAATNRIDGKLPVTLRYVVANPSSYLYLDAWRPAADPGAACPQFNNYKFGLAGMTSYPAETGAEFIKKNYPLRNVTYLLGELDNIDAHSMDKTCPAMAQGPNRFERGQAFFEHLNKLYQTSQKLLTIPGCDHNGECMYRAEKARAVVFGK